MKNTINFLPIDYDYFDFNGRNYFKIVGKDDEGKHICIIDSFEPFLYAIFREGINEKRIKDIKEKIEKITIETENRTTKVEKILIEDKKFLGREVKALKIFMTNYKDAHPVADQLDFPEIEFRREYDIPLITKYITEKNLRPLVWKKITGEILNNSEEFGGIDSILDVDLVIKVEKIENTDKQPEFSPKIIAFDLECDEFEIGKGEILMISIAGNNNLKKVLTWKKSDEKPEFVEFFKDEEEMLEAFVKIIKKEKPDLLAGYFSDGFDMPYLKARAEKFTC